MKRFVARLALLIGVAIVINLSYNEAVAHNFYKNEASVFFTLIKQFEVENNLVESNFPTINLATIAYSSLIISVLGTEPQLIIILGS
jgi:hypothetical protein